MNFENILDFTLFTVGDYVLQVKNIVYVALVILSSIFLFWASNKGLRRYFSYAKFTPKDQRAIRRFIRSVIVFLTIVLTIRSLNFDLTIIFGYKILPIGKENWLKIGNIVNVFLVIIGARVLLWLLAKGLKEYFENRDIDDIGTKYAITQFLKYIIIVSAIITSIDTLGYELKVVWGGLAALLVGFGLGLQQTFNDLASGIIMLLERKVEVGDTVEVDNFVGTIKKIGIRTSDVLTRDNILVIVPNSHLVTESVINWSHKQDFRRFVINIGVAYGSDTDLVKKTLIQVTNNHPKVAYEPKPFIRFINFGDSSLDFEIHFWSNEIILIEDVKSDIRFSIDQAFREHNIEIPFPQRDVWVRNQSKV